MRKNLLSTITLLFLGCVLSSCTKEIAPGDKTLEKQSHRITTDEALASLNCFMSSFDTKSSSKNIANVFPIYSDYNAPLTKSTGDRDTLLYIANFENNEGYAILSADDRIGTNILAYTEQGFINNPDSTRILITDARRIDNRYPLTGKGLFTIEEAPDEIFLNPNTFELYDEGQDDFFVGDYAYEEDSTEALANLQSMIVDLSVSYAKNEIQSYSIDPGSVPSIAGYQGKIKNKYIEVNTLYDSGRLLEEEVMWKQTEPFNDLFPKVREYFLLGDKITAYTGCFPLAIAKILAFHEYPQIYNYNGISVNWKELKKDFNSDIGSRSAAALLFSISRNCNSLYFYQGTFTFPKNCVKYLNSTGYKNASLIDYNTEQITLMIDSGRPLAICSVPSRNWHDYDLAKSHAWNIDGYRINQSTIIRETYIGKKLISSSKTLKDPVTLVHCDWGWKGSNNGYFLSGLFDLASRDKEKVNFDEKKPYYKNTNYNFFLKLITYDK